MPRRTRPAALRFLSPIHRATRQFGLWFDARLSDLGVSPGECHLIAYLCSYGPCSVGELKRVFGHKPSTLTSLLDRLVGQGLVKRDTNPDDRRSFLVRVTPAGRRLGRRARRLTDELETAIAGQVTVADREGFQAVMAAIDRVTGVVVRPTQSTQQAQSTQSTQSIPSQREESS